MSDKIVIGKCSICGGRVTQYTSLMIVGPFPPAQCESCGAVEANNTPVIPMERPKNSYYKEAPYYREDPYYHGRPSRKWYYKKDNVEFSEPDIYTYSIDRNLL